MTDGGTVYLESGYSDAVRERLRQMGHSVATEATNYGGYQAIRRDVEQGVYYGASESRKDGQAAGY
jgi:gamma-glutamyltranspeptidase/glutathione hydrolase